MHTTLSPRPRAAEDADFYPTSDGRPLGETPTHFRNSLLVTDALETRFGGDPQVYIAGNMFLYYVQGDRWKHVSPDVFIVFGVPRDKPRKAYFLWEEGKAPDLVVELTSQSTLGEDIDDKKAIYRDILGVREYILFDPYGEYLNPRLQGFRLEDGQYVPLPMVSGRLPSAVLGLEFEPCGMDLRLYDPAAGHWLATPDELRRMVADAAVERDRVAAERDRVVDEKSRLEAEIAELRRRLAERGEG
ncbi:MAG TPA: Uma2 family endonuclease [Pirellulales bacterium]